MRRAAASVNSDQAKYRLYFSRISNTPRYLLLAFKENKGPEYVQNDSKACIETIQSIQVQLNQTRFPIESNAY